MPPSVRRAQPGCSTDITTLTFTLKPCHGTATSPGGPGLHLRMGKVREPGAKKGANGGSGTSDAPLLFDAPGVPRGAKLVTIAARGWRCHFLHRYQVDRSDPDSRGGTARAESAISRADAAVQIAV
jgi:hypothetical protein